MKIVDIKENLHDKCVLKVLSYCHYMPTDEKLNSLADKYKADEHVSAFACIDGKTIIGVIAVKSLSAGSFEISDIAVEAVFRGKGIASKLISYVIKELSCIQICAETDDDAVGFYRNFGFNIKSLGEKYPGCIRYLCTLKLF
jgi:Acetyltransferases